MHPQPTDTTPLLLALAFGLLIIASLWNIFTKAGQPGWAALIPLYNLYILLLIVGKPAWWLLLLLIPLVNLVISVILTLELAKRFGKPGAFALGLLFLPFLFYPILAFGDARYHAPSP